MNQALSYTDAHFNQYVDELIEFLRIPSVSTDPDHAGDVRAAASWLADHLNALGMQNVDIMETPGYPIVYAEYMVDQSKPTILVYGHYDVQPPDPLDLWDSAPFDPVVKNGDLYAAAPATTKASYSCTSKRRSHFSKAPSSFR